MGHQLARAAVAAALTLTVACGGDGEVDEPPPVLDNARELAAEARTAASSDDATEAPPDVAELAPPDPSTFVGANRIVNLVTSADAALDVWAARTFETGPVLLAADVAFGGASDWFAVPPLAELEVVRSGAGPDGVVVADLLATTDGERLTTFVIDGPDGIETNDLWESGPRALAPPDPGRALVVVVAPNTGSFREELRAGVGSDSFYVGDGSGSCWEQRVERDGFQPEVLGGPSVVEITTRAGPATISLHPWPSPEACATPPVATVDVDVDDRDALAVVVYTTDGSTLDALLLPLRLEP